MKDFFITPRPEVVVVLKPKIQTQCNSIRPAYNYKPQPKQLLVNQTTEPILNRSETKTQSNCMISFDTQFITALPECNFLF